MASVDLGQSLGRTSGGAPPGRTPTSVLDPYPEAGELGGYARQVRVEVEPGLDFQAQVCLKRPSDTIRCSDFSMDFTPSSGNNFSRSRRASTWIVA